MKTGVWIGSDRKHPAAMVILFAYTYGWDGKDPEEPGVDIVALAVREMFDDPELTDDESDNLAFRWPGYAEDWLNANVAPEGYKFGWHDDEFYLESDQWWEQRGGPDQMWLP